MSGQHTVHLQMKAELDKLGNDALALGYSQNAWLFAAHCCQQMVMAHPNITVKDAIAAVRAGMLS